MPTSRWLASATATATAALALVASTPAAANGRFPNAQHVVVGPGNESRVIALRVTFGLVVSEDGGQTFHWLCEEVLDYAGPPYDPSYALDATGRIHVGLTDGLVRVAADRCAFQRTSTFESEVITDLDQSATGTSVVAVTSSSGPTNRVFRSDDSGATFRGLGAGVANVLWDTVEIAPTDPNRLYLTGVRRSSQGAVFYRSDDGGTTLREVPFNPPTPLPSAFIAGIDPTNAATVYVRANTSGAVNDAGESTPSGVLLRTTDAGATWEEIGRTQGLMLGFAVSDDGRTLWMGGPDPADRLQRSDDGGRTFRRVNDVQVRCLRYHAGTLYVCADNVEDGYALGRSRNNGDAIEPLVSFGGIQSAFACPANSPETTECAARWPETVAQFPPVRDAGGVPPVGTDAAAPMDTGTPASADAARSDVTGAAEVTRSRGTCSCRVVGAPWRGDWRAALGFVGVALVLRRRSRSRRALARP